MPAKPELPIIAFADAAGFEAWLAAEHASSAGIWLKYAKKATGYPTVTHSEAIDVALCYGWIDGQGRALDDEYWLVKFTPRGRKSVWSQINVGRVAALTTAGRMRPGGLAAVALAQADGRWDRAYAPPSTAAVPDDFQAALDGNPAAADFFATLTGANRYAFLYRIQDAKRPETRARRIAQFTEKLAAGEKLQ